VRCYDLRKSELEYTLTYHADTVTGLAMNQDGSNLLSNGIDMTLRVFDVRYQLPHLPKDRMWAARTAKCESSLEQRTTHLRRT
jgi:Prp8 binding protein